MKCDSIGLWKYSVFSGGCVLLVKCSCNVMLLLLVIFDMLLKFSWFDSFVCLIVLFGRFYSGVMCGNSVNSSSMVGRFSVVVCVVW